MTNKLLLIEDVESLGRSGDIVGVKPGYARNFLIPQGLAVIASKQALRRQATLKKAREEQAIEDRKSAESLAGKLEGQTVTTIVKVDHDGHMYGSVTVSDIAELIEKAYGVQLEKRAILVKHPIKAVGLHTIAVKLKEGVTASFIVSVEAENKALNQKEDK